MLRGEPKSGKRFSVVARADSLPSSSAWRDTFAAIRGPASAKRAITARISVLCENVIIEMCLGCPRLPLPCGQVSHLVLQVMGLRGGVHRSLLLLGEPSTLVGWKRDKMRQLERSCSAATLGGCD